MKLNQQAVTLAPPTVTEATELLSLAMKHPAFKKLAPKGELMIPVQPQRPLTWRLGEVATRTADLPRQPKRRKPKRQRMAP